MHVVDIPSYIFLTILSIYRLGGSFNLAGSLLFNMIVNFMGFAWTQFINYQ